MKKMFKKMVVLCVSFVMAISAMTVTVSAEEKLYGLSVTPPAYNNGGNDISPHDNNYPTKVWNLATQGMYTAEGEANGQADIYTLYRFTGVDSISISVNNWSSKDLKVTLYKYGLITTIEGSFTASANNGGGKLFLKLDADKQYYFGFSAPCNFTAYIA